MDEDLAKEINSDDTANTSKDSKELIPLEVKIVNHPEVKKSDYDSTDDDEYSELGITQEQLKEFEDGKEL